MCDSGGTKINAYSWTWIKQKYSRTQNTELKIKEQTPSLLHTSSTHRQTHTKWVFGSIFLFLFAVLGFFLCVFAVVFYLLVVVPSDYCGQCAFLSAFLPWVSDSVNMLMLYKYFALFCSCFHIKLWTMSLNSQDCYLLFLHISLIRCFRIFVLESWQVKGHLTSDPIDSDMRLDNFKARPRACVKMATVVVLGVTFE